MSALGDDFYRLSRNVDRITLVRATLDVPREYAFGEDVVVPLRAGGTLRWRVSESD